MQRSSDNTMRRTATDKSTPSDGTSSSTKQLRRKKYHKRSRKGCLTCRKRRVKCDEGRPVCIKCLVLGLSCHYDATPRIPSTPAISRNQTVGSPRGQLAPSTVLPVDMVLASPRFLNDYMQYRNRVRATVPISPRAEPIGLPAFMENPTGLRMTLVLSIAHMRLREGSSTGIEQTSIIHKLGVLDDIKQLIATSSVDISDFVQTTIALLFQIEFAAGDRDAAEAHLRGMINLEATHSDTQAQQLRARITLSFYSLISRGIISHKG
ncbi:hypothetical protein QBC37DRAFT_380850 [Rhypophila decipiens]|uniref:Zn(2)-C6 fungal-type domain-containing protein n=1 Tax=Rhypophila decipiens TaxID=261697 RepID=A0AAN7AZ17_9PEZI|nr:hypothetical protein QBC37DRAFT_380850 [Rhypophila decipiens]